MSRSSKRTKKEKRKTREGMKLPLYCPNCRTPIPNSIYKDVSNALDYQCVMCGNFVFSELKRIIEENKQLKLIN